MIAATVWLKIRWRKASGTPPHTPIVSAPECEWSDWMKIWSGRRPVAADAARRMSTMP